MLRSPPRLPAVDPAARERYRARYRRFFRPDLLRRKRIGVYQHSSVARDLIPEVLAGLGADVVPLGRTDTFVPVDTEAVSEADERQAREWVAAHGLDARVSTATPTAPPRRRAGHALPRDVIGILCARFLGARTVVTP